ncbi:MAG: putative metal-binding motif-containing protein [Myxococcales bacterium]|nr:putative metal-binding motif-containing protein [Myxococcales bacterium]
MASLCAAAAACYQVPGLSGPYRCQSDGSCGDPSLVCDDGICCQPFGLPLCPTLVLDGGRCANGATPKTWFLDKDGDAFGDRNSERLACAKPVSTPESAPEAKWIEQGGDCDDGDPGVKPGATEACDELDNDCDGEKDEGFVRQTYYADADKDGFGKRGSAGFVLCAAQGDYTSTDPRDCDDANPAMNPDSTEKCNGVDDDCANGVDDNPSDVGAPCASGLSGVCAEGTIVCSTSGALKCDANVKPNTRAEACNGVDDDCDDSVDEGLASLCLLAPGEAIQRAKDSGVRTGGANQGCLGSGGTSTGWASPVWSASGYNTQVFYAERGSSAWNVGGKVLEVAFVAELDNVAGVWSAWKQPAVILCAKDGTYARFIHTSDINWNAKGTKVSLSEAIPLNLQQWDVSAGGWTQTQAAPPYDRVYRVEVHLETSGSPASPFTVRWTKFQIR